MLQRLTRWSAILMTAVALSNCNNQPVQQRQETTTSGTIHISVDESFKPVIDSQIKVFEASYPNARIIPHYKSEAECIKDLLVDSIRMVIITRQLLPVEETRLSDTLSFIPIQGKIAFDAVALIVNNQMKDSILDMTDVRSILKGTSAYKLRPVMDGLTATSTVRYALDSILAGQPMSKEVTAATSSQGVIDYVAEHKDAIGFVGVSWIGNPEDPAQLSFQKKVTIASVRCGICPEETYVKPYQANIAMRRYPMVRSLNYILKENYEGLGSGFVNFLIYERGQLIFRRSYLWPARMQFEVRNAGINE
ncbi:substrate-binding domain-containing protein [Flavihumibacter rivuli]|uniref:PstS family phosphate ABC transporter substrate-binding protein n=1 Tax=Flavihumibacter rivuli TaxID=2838156 RepID=UPI001BDE7EC0|nr:substrate-binding domain-containing protein [Flavihumibacter rivuli]ULQ58358.1 substrate-binding domain-containing protein [Flavihumibacter rivuli]